MKVAFICFSVSVLFCMVTLVALEIRARRLDKRRLLDSMYRTYPLGDRTVIERIHPRR